MFGLHSKSIISKSLVLGFGRSPQRILKCYKYCTKSIEKEGRRKGGKEGGRERKRENLRGERKTHAGWIQVASRLLRLNRRMLKSCNTKQGRRKRKWCSRHKTRNKMVLSRTQRSPLLQSTAKVCLGVTSGFTNQIYVGHQRTSHGDHSCTRLFRFFP